MHHVSVPEIARFPVDVMFPVFMSCPDTFLHFPETTPVSVVVMKLKRSSLSSQIVQHLYQNLFLLQPESYVFATPEPIAVFNAMIGSSVAISLDCLCAFP